jgi:hypothetical protein
MNEKENTARILKEQPILVTGFWCRFGLHNWTKWDKGNMLGIHETQVRRCVHCDIMYARTVLLT